MIFFLCRFYIRDEWLNLEMILVLAAVTKNAQIPLFAWLSIAIAEPTNIFLLLLVCFYAYTNKYFVLRLTT